MAVNPYAAPQAQVADGATGEPELATRGERFVAAAVDGLIFGGVGMLSAIFIPLLGGLGRGILSVIVVIAFVAVIGINLRLLYLYGATIGKRVVKIRVTRTDGSDASLVRLVFVRGLPQWVLSAIPLLNLLTLVDVLYIFGAARRCVHDYIADTIVVKAE